MNIHFRTWLLFEIYCSFSQREPPKLYKFQAPQNHLPLNTVVTFDEIMWIQYVTGSSGSNPEHVDYEIWLFIVAYKSR
jgi:hypothetical protein